MQSVSHKMKILQQNRENMSAAFHDWEWILVITKGKQKWTPSGIHSNEETLGYFQLFPSV